MTITRCPSCLKVFRVSDEQLRSRSGRVRCGHCYRPFDALAHRVPEQQVSADKPLAAHAGKVSTAVLEPASREATDPDSQADHDTLLEFGVPDRPPGIPPRATPIPMDTHAGQGLDSTEIPGATIATSGRAQSAPARDTVPRAHSLPSPTSVRSLRDEDDWVEPSLESDDGLPAPATASVAALEASAADDDLDEWRAGLYRNEAPATPHRWLWALGIGVLLGTLAVQAIYLYREPITREWPQLRPLYLEACARLGCDMPLPRLANQIMIEATTLNPSPDKGESAFLLEALVHNRAEHPQQYPYLELTLTNKDDQTMARRALAPDDWLPPGSDIEAGFAARQTTELRLSLATPELSGAVGYRLNAFYP